MARKFFDGMDDGESSNHEFTQPLEYMIAFLCVLAAIAERLNPIHYFKHNKQAQR